MAVQISSAEFVKFLQEQVKEGAGYIMCSFGQNPKTGYHDLSITDVKDAWKSNGWYYTQYSGRQREKALYWREHSKRVFDCAGLAEGCYQIKTGVNVNTKARFIYANWCDKKGTGMIPVEYRVPGAAIFWGNTASSIHHVAYLEKPVKEGHPEGDWYFVEAKGVMYGVVRSKLYSRKPNYWGLMTKYYSYENTTAMVEDTSSTSQLGARVLKKGMEGEDVRDLQQALIRLGFSCGKWGADGEFGTSTRNAVIAFQTANGLEADGEIGAQTLAKLNEQLKNDEVVEEVPATKVQIQVTGSSVYIRNGVGTSNQVMKVAHKNEIYDGTGKTENGWNEITFDNETGWISGKYSKVIGA